MDSEQCVKIESALSDCLTLCNQTERPFLQLTAFIERLRIDGWTPEEIIELQTRVIRILLYRGTGQPPPPAINPTTKRSGDA